VQLNSYLYGGGVRYYPFHTGLVLGADVGLAKLIALSNLGYGGTSPAGWAAAAVIAYDFNTKLTGVSLQAGLRAQYQDITGGSASAVSAFIDLAWK
jgi:hypothetical protein